MNHARQLFSRNILVKITNFTATKISRQNFSIFTSKRQLRILIKPDLSSNVRCISSISAKLRGQDSNSQVPAKKRPRKKWTDKLDNTEEGLFNVMAFATAEEYDLEKLVSGLLKEDLYEMKKFFSTDSFSKDPDALYVTAKYQVGNEPRDIFFFREGTVVLWNTTELESSNVLTFLKEFELDTYDDHLIQGESELMQYNYTSIDAKPHLNKGQFFLTKDKEEDNFLEKYTFSNALSLSVKLGIWEANLEKYVHSMEFVTDNLKRGTKIKISRAEMLRKTGELFELRHLINLSSDLLDTPDFYWDREQLENLYSQTCSYLSIQRRTRVMNEKLNHCVELADLISSNLNDVHHCRLEWMIIVLIMVEVVFETIHYMDRFVASDKDGSVAVSH